MTYCRVLASRAIRPVLMVNKLDLAITQLKLNGEAPTAQPPPPPPNRPSSPAASPSNHQPHYHRSSADRMRRAAHHIAATLIVFRGWARSSECAFISCNFIRWQYGSSMAASDGTKGVNLQPTYVSDWTSSYRCERIVLTHVSPTTLP